MRFVAEADGGRNYVCNTVVCTSKTWVFVPIPVRYFHSISCFRHAFPYIAHSFLFSPLRINGMALLKNRDSFT